MREASREPFGGGHISGLDLERLIRNDVEKDPEKDVCELVAHLEGCSECREHMALYQAQSERLEALGRQIPGERRESCPDIEVWMNVAAGLVEEPEAGRLLDHVAACGHCGEELKGAVQVLRLTDIPNEAADVLSTDFRRQVVKAVSGQWPKKKQAWSNLVWLPHRWAYAAPAVLSLVVGSLYWITKPNAATLLEVAYTTHRTLEIRFPGAVYSPMRALKGSGEEPKSEASLVEAELLILRGLSKEPDSPKWLQLQARLDLLRWRYDRAIATLERLEKTHSGSPSILLDLGNAYLLRGMHQEKSTDLQKAVEYLSGGMRRGKNPSEHRLALFNRAIALEQLHLWEAAEGDWKQYLQLDSASGWASEGRDRLRRIGEKKKSWRNGLPGLQMTPAAFLAESDRHASLSTEAALDRALNGWLADMFSAGSAPQSIATAAVRRLAEIIVERHQDYWLKDLLAHSGHPIFPRAVISLTAAIRANAEGNRSQAQESARRAEHLFVEAGSVAGSLRARVEQVYALSRDFRSAECLAAARGIAESLAARKYRWSYAQLQLERSTCSIRMGDLGNAEGMLNDALENIKRAGYSTLLLRGLGLAADLLVTLGRYEEASQQDWQGLRIYWAGTYHPSRAYQFYANWSLLAEREKLWEFGYLVSRDAIPLIELTGPPSTHGMARFRAAMFAGMTDRIEAMQFESKQANEILDRISQHGVGTMRAENELLAASYYLESGRIKLARRALEAVRTQELQDSILFQLAFHQEKGSTALKEQRLDEGRKDLASAWGLAESALSTVRTEKDRANWKQVAGPVYRQLVRLALDYDHDPEFALALWERFRSASIRGSKDWGAADVSAATLRRWAVHYRNTSVLVFAQLDDTLAGWFYDDRGIHPFRSGLSAPESARLCTDFQRMAARRNSSMREIRELSRHVYDALILPIESHLDPKRLLLLEPDGACSGIPFEILMDRQGKYLVDRLALATSPGCLPNVF